MRKPLVCLLALTLLSLGFTTAALAETGLDFMKADPIDQIGMMKPLVTQFVAEGYKGIPDDYPLMEAVDKLIRDKGYGDKDLIEIGREAATGLGMTK